jgi:hypothetical protein
MAITALFHKFWGGYLYVFFEKEGGLLDHFLPVTSSKMDETEGHYVKLKNKKQNRYRKTSTACSLSYIEA